MNNLVKINCRNCYYSFYQDSTQTYALKESIENDCAMFNEYDYADCPACGGVLELAEV